MKRMELAIGFLIGVLFGSTCAGPIKALLAEFETHCSGITGYIWFGAILAYLVAAMEWLGLAVGVTAFLAYHFVKSGLVGNVAEWSRPVGRTSKGASKRVDALPEERLEDERPRVEVLPAAPSGATAEEESTGVVPLREGPSRREESLSGRSRRGR
ncbi:MAG: hypothetical protein ACRDD1_05615 [Planctomycetia bacterium]